MAKLGRKSKLLEYLADLPVTSSACKKTGINRTTFYRWYENDINFRNRVDEIMTIGKKNIADVGKVALFKQVQEGNLRAIIFMLQHYDPDFRPVRTTYVDPTEHTHRLLPGETCRTCGYSEAPIDPYIRDADAKMSNGALAKELGKRLRFASLSRKTETEIKEIIDDFVETNQLKIQIEVLESRPVTDADLEEVKKQKQQSSEQFPD
jgi:hypothetical protein